MFRSKSNQIADESAYSSMENRLKGMESKILFLSSKLNEYVDKYIQLKSKAEGMARTHQLTLGELKQEHEKQHAAELDIVREEFEQRVNSAEKQAQKSEERASVAEERVRELNDQLQQAENRAKAAEDRFRQSEERVQTAEQRYNAELSAAHKKLEGMQNRAIDIRWSGISKVLKFLQKINAEECPIDMEPMTEPVALECGHVFEKKNIKYWIKTNAACPICRVACVKSSDISDMFGVVLRSETGVPDKAMTQVLEHVLFAIRDMEKTVIRLNNSWDLFKRIFTYARLYGPRHLAEDPVLFPCGELIDKKLVGNKYCTECDCYHENFKPLPPYLQRVWELVNDSAVN